MLIKPEHTAYIFPGQGSQKIGMGFELAQKYFIAKELFDQSDRYLSDSISMISWQGPDEELNDTYNTQPALLTHSIAALYVFHQHFPGFSPAYVAGHSMGEFSALVAAGSCSFSDTLMLVRKRGELMRAAGNITPGGMAAILGLDIQTIDQICNDASTPDDLVQVANDNCPGQIVISGTNSALDRAIKNAMENGARKVTRLAVSIASHSPLMKDAQASFFHSINNTLINDPVIPVVGNVYAVPLLSSTEIKNDLYAQLTSKVRWTESINYMIDQGIKLFLEFGSGSVLTNLLKRINKDVKGVSLSSPQDFDNFVRGEV